MAEMNFKNAITVSLLESVTSSMVSATAGTLSFRKRHSSSLDRLSKSTPANPLLPNADRIGHLFMGPIDKLEDTITTLGRKGTFYSPVFSMCSIAQLLSHRCIDNIGTILFYRSILRLLHGFNSNIAMYYMHSVIVNNRAMLRHS